MKYLVLLVFLLAFWGLAYALVGRLVGAPEGKDALDPEKQKTRLRRYVEWLKTSLDTMFYQVSEQVLSRVVLGLVLVAGLVGFFAPSTLPGIDRMTIDKAVQFNREAKFKQALRTLRDFSGSQSPIVHNELGVAYLGRRNYDDAQQAFRRAIRLLPTYAKAHANLATVYMYKENQERMRFELSRAKQAQQYPLSEEQLYNLTPDPERAMLMRVLVAVVFMLAAWQLPRAGIKYLRNRRMKQYDEQLPDALIMASNGLKAGFSLLQALEVVAKETSPPISQEFELLLKEHKMGAELDDALEHLAERIPSMDTRIFVNSLMILRETGGNLTEIFDTLAETIKERKRVHQKIKTMTAEGTTQAYILAVLPVVLGFIMYKLNPEDVGLLFTTFIGWMLLLLMGLMEVVGLLWMLKMVKVKI